MIKKLFIAAAVISVIALAGGYVFYRQIFGPNINSEKAPYTLYIHPGSSFEEVFATLQRDSVLRNNTSFRFIAKWMHYERPQVPSGRYLLKAGLSNYEIVSKLRIANQDPIRLTFRSARTLQELSGQLAKPLALDSIEILSELHRFATDSTDEITKENILSYFIPNTYLMYWDIPADKLLQRLLKEHRKYWSDAKRKAALAKLKMTPAEVYTLASIVEKESNLASERPVIAGVYLNRLRRGIKLQADPTVVFASGNFELRRVLNKHLKIESPYNTYLHEGLPPGPICMPSLKSIEAVLYPEEHNYLFFCAKPGYTGAHNFATNLRGHSHNARIYRQWLNSQKIK